ncbi:MAG: Holliday junction resolvase RuvX [Parashewanella sp.]
MSQTVLGFDFGTKSIGIAVGQAITYQASPVQAVKANDGVPNWNVIEQIISKWQPDLLVVGLPLNMDGSEQPVTQRAKKFANRLHGRFGIEVKLQDERLTTTDAKARLFELGGYKKLAKDQIDAVSAVLIVESYFENN